ncbi:DEAD/DEAH box helicase family protein [Flavobacterium filum]|uniref:DEAD/DEAH box helicase family protein n=1 Tax=Flavobacterium filum TaxID=370974 RepID=UPI0023F31376|nr:DEAD/DEAH box helicase family protein [Flavobacterium filum]
MLKEINWSNERSYRTGSDFEPIQFYLDCLINSTELDLLLGYFSSSAINVLSLGFAKFLSNGGTVRLIINDVLSEKDKLAFERGLKKDVPTNLFDISNFKTIKESLDEYGVHFFECLAWLITTNKIDIRIIRPKSGNGISHYKSGVFYDSESSVGFKASCNFTAFGLLENLEELDAFLLWENSRSEKWIKGQKEYFNRIFNYEVDFAEYVNVSDVRVALREQFGNKDLSELIVSEKELLQKKIKKLNNEKLKHFIDDILKNFEKEYSEPKFPYREGPREYQAQAYENWKNNNHQGIFAMATGTGKTITALNCILEEFKKSDNHVYHAMILVPTLTLVEQWYKEALSFSFTEVITVSSKKNWRTILSTRISTAKRVPSSFIIICTYASFVKDIFQGIVKEMPKDTIFIADEGHNLASPNVLAKLSNIRLDKRIGLSATPKRIYDELGTSAMEEFFNDSEPYTFSYSMGDAIAKDILCKYYYYPAIVKLTEIELVSYIEISKKLTKLYSMIKGNPTLSDAIAMLLLQRKRIIHKASNKLGIAENILANQFNKNGDLKYTFVYVPEGYISNEIESDNDEIINEDIRLINQYTNTIASIDDSISVNQFISGMSYREEILEQFESGDIQVITSMKCLDEGVDIPRAEFAVFCSSTGNPRQFIQRRGRILRKHPDKHIATIHDLVVIPDYQNLIVGSENFKTERKLVEKELERVMYFASLSINPYYSEDVFKDVCEFYDLNIYTIQNKLKTI